MANICIIPARGGSKRIPKKNIKDFFGKPLIAYSIEVAKESGLFESVVVSTDSLEIAEVASSFNAEVMMRPAELSDDFTTSGAVVRYVVQTLREQGRSYEFVCTLYATAPLLEKKYLIEGYEKLKNSDACSSFSVTSTSAPIWRTFAIENGRCKMFFPEHFYTRSQDFEESYQDAGQFYWDRTGCSHKDVFFGRESIPVVLPRELVQDLDTLEDWRYLKKLYRCLKG